MPSDGLGRPVLSRRAVRAVPCPVCGSTEGCYDLAEPGREPRWVAPHIERVRAALALAETGATA